MKKRSKKLLLNKNSIANLSIANKVKGGNTTLGCLTAVCVSQQATCQQMGCLTVSPNICNTTDPDTQNTNTGPSCNCEFTENANTVGTSCSVC